MANWSKSPLVYFRDYSASQASGGIWMHAKLDFAVFYCTHFKCVIFAQFVATGQIQHLLTRKIFDIWHLIFEASRCEVQWFHWLLFDKSGFSLTAALDSLGRTQYEEHRWPLFISIILLILIGDLPLTRVCKGHRRDDNSVVLIHHKDICLIFLEQFYIQPVISR